MKFQVLVSLGVGRSKWISASDMLYSPTNKKKSSLSREFENPKIYAPMSICVSRHTLQFICLQVTGNFCTLLRSLMSPDIFSGLLAAWTYCNGICTSLALAAFTLIEDWITTTRQARRIELEVRALFLRILCYYRVERHYLPTVVLDIADVYFRSEIKGLRMSRTVVDMTTPQRSTFILMPRLQNGL